MYSIVAMQEYHKKAMYNQKCNEMSDSCRERLKNRTYLDLFLNNLCNIVFLATNITRYESLFIIYASHHLIVTKSSYLLVHIYNIYIIPLFYLINYHLL
ncbi:hypothetical protein BOQ23_06570 [Listeria monocytogenes]|nr:hypothetical protein [Listeria monocytogenes]